ncbi:MAG: nuclear transport factor 2 family protein [Pseudomonadales bacterium]
MSEAILQVAGALFAQIEAGNPDGVAALYADDVAVWHNFSNVAQSKSENLRTLGGLINSTAGIRYEVIERLALDGERVMQRHNLHCTTRTGEEFLIPACMFMIVRDGKIVRIDEYLDTGQANALRAATGRAAVNVP